MIDPNKKIIVLFRNDDPGALSNPEKEKRILGLFAQYNVPQVLAVIPNNIENPHSWLHGKTHWLDENPELIKLLQDHQSRGLVEVAQHGFTHQTNRFRPSIREELTNTKFYAGIDRKWSDYQPAHPEGYSEFSGLSEEEQRQRIQSGQDYLTKHFGKLQSFIFPWNTFDSTSLKILEEMNFKYVPGEEDELSYPGLCVIGACNWDWHIDDFKKLLKKLESLSGRYLVQFGYHSWEINDEMIAKIEDLLKYVTNNSHYGCILPNQLPSLKVDFSEVAQLRRKWIDCNLSLNLFLKDQFEIPKYYILSPSWYKLRILKCQLFSFIFKKLGLARWYLGMLVGFLFFLIWSMLRVKANEFNFIDVFPGVILMLGVRFAYWLSARTHQKLSLKMVIKSVLKRFFSESAGVDIPSVEAVQPNQEKNSELKIGVGKVNFGDFNRVTPIGLYFGAERGTPIDRLYIEKFLKAHSACVRGTVLELEDNQYTRIFGGANVTQSDVLNLDPGNPRANIIGDLIKDRNLLGEGKYDCIIMTQALFMMYELQAAVANLYRSLKPGGDLLITVPGIAQWLDNEGASWDDLWRFTRASVRKLLAEKFPEQNISVTSYGNIYVAVSLLHGLALEELDPKKCEFQDNNYEVILGARAQK